MCWQELDRQKLKVDGGPLPASSALRRPPAAGWNEYALIHSVSTHAVQYAHSRNHASIQPPTLWCSQTWTQIQVKIHTPRPHAASVTHKVQCQQHNLRLSSPIVLPSTFLSPSFCYRLFHLSLFSTSSRSHYLCSLGTSVVQRQYGFFYYQVIHCVLCRQVKEFSATGLCTVSDLMHTRILQTCFHLPPSALCIPLHSPLAVEQGCGLEL